MTTTRSLCEAGTQLSYRKRIDSGTVKKPIAELIIDSQSDPAILHCASLLRIYTDPISHQTIDQRNFSRVHSGFPPGSTL